MSKASKPQVTTQKQELPPEFSRALSFLLDQSQGLANNPIVPELSQATQTGINQLQQPTSPGIQNLLQDTLSGQYLNSNPYTNLSVQDIIPGSAYSALNNTAGGNYLYGGNGFNAAVDSAFRSAKPNILSTFGRAGTGTGGLAQTAINQAYADAFANQYGAERANQLNAAGTLADLGNQNINRGYNAYQAERGQQVPAAIQLDALRRQDVQDFLRSGQLIDQQQQQKLLEPFTRLQYLSGPLASAISGAPMTTTTTQPTNRNVGAGILGGAATGLGLGSLTAGSGATGLAALGGPLGIGLGVGGALLGGLF